MTQKLPTNPQMPDVITPGSRAQAWFLLLRPRHWIKNGLVYAALLFSGQLANGVAFQRATVAFLAFCMACSAVYCLNDIVDAPADRQHPRKQHRPVASGRVTPTESAVLAAALSTAAIWGSFAISGGLGAVILVYLVLNILYSLILKQVVLLDIMTVAAGFVLRAFGGALAIGVTASRWFEVCILLLSLLLAATKRRHEVFSLGQPGNHRKVLSEYPIQLLDEIIAVLAGAAIVTYMLYTMEADRHPWLVLTSPLVIYGVFRQLYLVYRRHEGGSPEESFVTDLPLMLTVVMWGLACVGIIYIRP